MNSSSARLDPEGEKMPVVLVAGGAGFLGSALCEALTLQNLEVVCVDSLLTGKRENLLDLETRPNFRFKKMDIINDALPRASYIFHLAGEEEYLDGLDVGLETLMVNSWGTRKLLEMARHQKAKFLLASSIDLYSGFLSTLDIKHYFGPKREDQRRFSHHEAKRFAEALVFEYFKKYDVDVRIVRLADVYGPKMSLETGLVLRELVAQAVKGKMLRVAGEGLTRLYPTFIDDVVYGLVKAMFNDGTKGKIYNLVNPTNVTVLELAYALQKVSPKKLTIVFTEEKEELSFPIHEVELRQAHEDLGWRPKIGLEEGLERTLSWYAKAPQQIKALKKRLEKKEKELKREKEILAQEVFEMREPPLEKPEVQVEEALAEPTVEVEEEGKDRRVEERLLLEKEEIPEKVEVKEPIKIRTSAQIQKPGEGVVVEIEPVGARLGRIFLGFLTFLGKLPKPGLACLTRFSFKPTFSALSFPTPLVTRRRLVFFLSLFVLTAVFFLPLGTLLGFTALGGINLKKTRQAILSQDFLAAKTYAARSETNLERARASLSSLRWVISMLKRKEQMGDWQALLLASQEMASGLRHASQALPLLIEGVKSVVGEAKGGGEESIKEAKLEIDLAEDQLALAEGEFKNIRPSDYPSFLRESVKEAREQIPLAREKLAKIQFLLQIFPEVTGVFGNRTYLLLFQNNMELRPGGGFIGSFGLLNFVGGQLTGIEIHDVYAADGQLKEPVLAPGPIKTLLGQPNWFLRDSNFSPHFPTNAAQAEWFLAKSLGIKVDGVVALDLSCVQYLLSAVGPLELPDYQEIVTDKNLFEKAEYYSEAQFFPGSTQKRDFLETLARALLDRLIRAEKERWPEIGQALMAALKQKHLMVYMHTPNLKKVIQEESFGGKVEIGKLEVGPEAPLEDYLMIVDANLGANKANFFLRREISHLVVINREGGVAERLTIEYDNQSPAETWPGGTYRNYLRVYVPSGSVLQKIQIGEVTDPGLVEKGRELGRTVWAMYVEVPIKKKIKVVLDYQLSGTLKFVNGVGRYSLLVQKQPGVIDDRLVVTVNYPSFYKIIKSEPTGRGSEQAIRYSTTLEEDREFRVEFVK